MEKENSSKEIKYEFFNKTLFFPEQGILVIGDLHIGYEQSLVESGILLPEAQVREAIENIEKIIQEIKEKGNNLRKVIFLGDIKHMFSYEWKEKANFIKILEALEKYVKNKDIIIVKGNHDTTDFTHGNMRDYYIKSGIAFVHGHKSFPAIFDKEIQIIVSGHLHPSIILEEKKGAKHETYKCFLIGSTKGKKFIVVPSFLDFYEGTPVNYYREDFMESFSIIPKKDMLKASIHVVGEKENYNFGKVGDL